MSDPTHYIVHTHSPHHHRLHHEQHFADPTLETMESAAFLLNDSLSTTADGPQRANALAMCLPEEMLRLQGSDLENLFFTVIFPPLCAIGIIGNCLNLMVLLNGEVRTKRTNSHNSHRLLVALALCDILFLLLMIPHSMANFDIFGLNYTFRLFYFTTKMHLISLANWCSAVTIWLVISICAERLLGIRSLLRANSEWSQCTTAQIITGVVAGSGVLTFYNHFSYHCVVRDLCDHAQVISKCFDVVQEEWPGNRTNITPFAVRAYVQWSIIINAAVIIVIPIVVMLALNFALLVVVRRQSFLMYNRLSGGSTASAGGESTSRRKFSAAGILMKKDSTEVPLTNPTMFRRSTDQSAQFHAEHRVTVTVCAIVTCFTITQGPSAIILSMSFFSGHKPPYTNANPLWYNVRTVASFLVIIGKTLNFVLFCLSSAAFRRRLFAIITKKLMIISRRSSFLGTTSTGLLPSQSSLLRKNTPAPVANLPSQPQRPPPVERRFSVAT